jgi:hypothetical protein
MNGCWVLFQDHPVVAFDNELDALREAVKTASTVVYVPFGMGFMAVRNGGEVFEPIIDEPIPYYPNPPGIAPGMLAVNQVPRAKVKPNVMGNDEERAAYIALLAQGANQMAPAEAGEGGGGAVTNHGVGIIEPS